MKKTSRCRSIANAVVLVMAAATMITACGGSGISGEYGGDDCPYKLTFKGTDTVYIQILGMMELPGQYKVDGNKVSVSAANWPGAVFTRNGNALEALFMGQKMVCKKLV